MTGLVMNHLRQAVAQATIDTRVPADVLAQLLTVDTLLLTRHHMQPVECPQCHAALMVTAEPEDQGHCTQCNQRGQ